MVFGRVTLDLPSTFAKSQVDGPRVHDGETCPQLSMIEDYGHKTWPAGDAFAAILAV